MTRALRLSLVCCGAQAAAGAVMLDRAVSNAAGATPAWTLAVPAATLLGLVLGGAWRRFGSRPWRAAAMAQIVVGIALGAAAAVQPTPGSIPAAIAFTLLAGMSSTAVAFALHAGGAALGSPAAALACLGTGAALAAPLTELVLILALGRETTLIVAATLAAGCGALILSRVTRLGEPALPPSAHPVMGTRTTSFLAGLAAVAAAQFILLQLERELGSGAYARALLVGAALVGLAAGASWVARAPQAFRAVRFVVGFTTLGLLLYAVFSPLGAAAFTTLRWLPFFDHDLALFSGALLALAAAGPMLVLGPAGSRHPGATAAGGVVSIALAALLGAAPTRARIEPIDADLLGMMGALLHPSPRTAMVIDDGSATARALRTFADIPTVDRIPGHGARLLCSDTRRFDVIAINGGDLGQDFSSAFFTAEHHGCVARLLRPGGVVVQRLVLAGMDGPSIRLALGTFALGFPHVQVWASGVDLLLAGSRDPIRADLDRWRAWLAVPGTLQASVRKHWDVRDAGDLLGHYIMDRATALRAIRDVVVNTDDVPRLELRVARSQGLSVPSPVDALWRARLRANEGMPETLGAGPSEGSVLAAAARGGHLGRELAVQTAEQAISLGGGSDALHSLLTARPPQDRKAEVEDETEGPRFLRAAEAPGAFGGLAVPDRLREHRGLIEPSPAVPK